MGKKIYPKDITTIFINQVLNIDNIKIYYGGITKQFLDLLTNSVIPLDTQQQIIDVISNISENEELTSTEKNNQMVNATINIANEDTVEDIKKEYGDYNARWLPSDSDNPSITHEQFYYKKFKVDKGLYDESYKQYVIPSERPNCKCGMELLGKYK